MLFSTFNSDFGQIIFNNLKDNKGNVAFYLTFDGKNIVNEKGDFSWNGSFGIIDGKSLDRYYFLGQFFMGFFFFYCISS